MRGSRAARHPSLKAAKTLNAPGNALGVRRRRPRLKALVCGCALGLALVSTAEADIFGARPSPTPGRPSTIAARMGEEMTESSARRNIAFRPFAPPRRILGVGLLPPFHGDDTRANRGIAFEYTDLNGRRYALAEWPANGGTIDNFLPMARAVPECARVRTFARGTGPNGIVWSTARGLIMTLQPDGANDARTLESEWLKLIRRGACG